MKLARGTNKIVVIPVLIFFILLLITIINQGILRWFFLFLAIVFLLITIFFIIFFRDPDRDIGMGIVAAADGKIREITNTRDDVVGDSILISVFMNIYNIHVNRAPLDGKITSITHKAGSHIPAFKKESDRNEHMVTILDTEIGRVKIVQIAGTIARRIYPYIHVGDEVKKGSRIGIIQFGSRVDIYLPRSKIKMVKVKVGDMIKAGVDTVAETNG